MINLEAKTKEQEILKEYLEQNASETLIDKINNGVKIEKDGKSLTNKKTLDSFMKYACDEARKQAKKGANYACVEDKTVFGWLMHYFQEDIFDDIVEKGSNDEKKEPYEEEVKEETSLEFEPLDEPKPIVNVETGEILDTPDFDNEIIMKLYGIFGNELEGY